MIFYNDRQHVVTIYQKQISFKLNMIKYLNIVNNIYISDVRNCKIVERPVA